MKKNKKISTSCIILAHTIDEKLQRAVASTQFFSETLIIATTDDKKEWKTFAKKNHCSLHFYLEHIESFSKVRNWAAEKADYDWVFFLDSDEVLEEDSEVKLQEFFATYAQSYHSLSVVRQDIFLGKKLRYGEANTKLVRCYNKTKHSFAGNVHETVESDLVFDTTITLDHYAHDSISEFLTDITVYAEMASYNETRNTAILIWKALTYPVAKWFHTLFIKKGTLDGYAGVTYATVMSIHSLAVRIFAYEKSVS